MNYHDSFCRFHKQFSKLDSLLKWVGIPFFAITSMFYITDTFGYPEIVICFLFNLLHVAFIWFSIRYITLKTQEKYPEEKFIFRRIVIEILAAKTFPMIILTVGSYFYRNILGDYTGFPELIDSLRSVYLSGILFGLLICAFYENFLLIARLSEKAIEAEHNKKISIEAQYKNLTNNLNPHFLFNSFNSLSAIIEENPKKAVDFVQELSTVYRYVLNSQKQTWIDLHSEIEFSKAYLSLLKMRFEDGLQIETIIDLEHQQDYVLPLTLQLLLENAVKHNNISQDAPLTIKITAKDGYLQVENNKQLKKVPQESTKVGLRNIEDRYRFLTQKQITVENSGSRFMVKVPLIKKSLAA